MNSAVFTFAFVAIAAFSVCSGQRVAPGVPPQHYQQNQGPPIHHGGPPDPHQQQMQYQQQQQQEYHQQQAYQQQQQQQLEGRVPPGVHPGQYQQQQQQQFQQQPPQQQFQQPPPQQQHHQQNVPHHPQQPPQQQQHHQQQQPHGQHPPHHQPQVLNPGNIQHEREHIAEHAEVPIDTSKMSEQELQFHYFKMHDADSNNKLDGCELIKSLIHYHGKHPGGKEGQDVHIYSDSDLAGFVDMVLKSMDKDNDGFINWMEYKRSEVAKNVADDRRN